MLAHWVKQTTTTTGSGALTLAAVSGFPTLNNAVGLNVPVQYHLLRDSDGKPLESGIGHLSDATTFVRDRITSTFKAGVFDSVGATAVNLGTDDAAGTWRLVCAPLASGIVLAAPGVDGRTAGVKRYMFSGHQPYNNAGDVKTLTANAQYVVPFKLEFESLVSGCAIEVTTPQTGSKARVAVYASAADGFVGAKILETGDISSAVAGVKEAVFLAPKRLTPGWYFVAVMSDAGIGVRANAAGQVLSTPFGMTSALMPIVCRYRTQTSGWTAMPDTLDAGSVSYGVTVDYSPRIALGTS